MWAEAGYVVAHDQLCLNDRQVAVSQRTVRKGGKVVIAQGDVTTAKAGQTLLVWEASTGNLQQMQLGGQPIFRAVDSLAAMHFSAFRAPTDNDRSFGNWVAKDWTHHGMATPRVEAVAFAVE